jgi:uridine kinase
MLIKPYLIGITGGSGSGKTSLIKKLREYFSADELCIISQDDYYKPRHLQHVDENGVKNFDLPESIEHEQLAVDIKKLLHFQTVKRTEYVFNNENKKPKTLIFKPAPIIVIEGLFVFYFEKMLDKPYDLRIFINAKDNIRVIRRIKRDRIERNYPLEDVLYRYEQHVMPAYEKFIEPYVRRADLVINNNQDFDSALEVLKGFIVQYLNKHAHFYKEN